MLRRSGRTIGRTSCVAKRMEDKPHGLKAGSSITRALSTPCGSERDLHIGEKSHVRQRPGQSLKEGAKNTNT